VEAEELDDLELVVGNLDLGDPVLGVLGPDDLDHRDLGGLGLGILVDGIDQDLLDRNELLHDEFHTKNHLGESMLRQKCFLGDHLHRSRFGIHGSIRQCGSCNLHE
jgi:hypothetical protein